MNPRNLSLQRRLPVPESMLLAFRLIVRYVFLNACLWFALAFDSAALAFEPDEENPEHEFYFARGIYTDDFGIGDENGGSWSIDYPEADRHFALLLSRLSVVDSSHDEKAVQLTDPELLNLPLIYALEVGSMELDAQEVESLREYLLSGGFLFIDDFWGSWAWENLVNQMMQVFPQRSIAEIPPWHPIFNLVYDVEEIMQVPNFHNGIEFERTGITHESDGTRARVHGIYDDAGRLMVLINENTDLGDAWEWADHPEYPVHFTTYAAKLGVNIVVYAMTH